MAIQYSGNAQSSTFTPATKQDIINSVGAALLTAGWTTVSGGTGTTAWKLQSATTPQGYAMRVLMKDNGGTCITFSLESTDGVLVGGNSTTVGGAFLQPGSSGFVYKVVCCKYEAWIYVTPNPGVSRTFAAFGCPWVPSAITASTSRIGWMLGNADTDTDATVKSSFRTTVTTSNPSNNAPAMQLMLNNVLWGTNSLENAQRGLVGMASFGILIYSTTTYGIWGNESGIMMDALIGWGATSVSDAAQIYGQPWDCFISTASYPGDQASTLDGHNWTTVTDNNSSQAGGTIFKAVS